MARRVDQLKNAKTNQQALHNYCNKSTKKKNKKEQRKGKYQKYMVYRLVTTPYAKTIVKKRLVQKTAVGRLSRKKTTPSTNQP